MRILWVASQLEGRGGIGRVVAEGARALAARGHEVHVAGPRASDDLAPFGNLPLDVWPPRRAKLARLVDLLPLLARLHPEIVHFHAARPHRGILVVTRALRSAVGAPRMAVTPHSSRPFGARRDRAALRAVDLVIAPSRWAREQASQAGATRVAVIPGGVEIGAPPRFEARELAVLALGRLDPVKGLDVLLDAFAAAVETRPGWQLWIAGEGPERDALRARAVALGCDSEVRLLGWVQDGTKRDLLARAAIGVLPSRRESFGGALLEMMERGLACVASDVGGVAEIAAGGAARLVPAGDAHDLATALGALMDDEPARLALARAGRRHAELYAWERVASAYEDAYRLLLAA